MKQLILITALFFSCKLSYSQWQPVRAFTLDNVDMVSNAFFLPDGKGILLSDNLGYVLKVNAENGSVIWRNFMGTPDAAMKSSQIVVLSASETGNLAVIFEKPWNATGVSELQVISTETGKKIKSLRETSKYYYKYGLLEEDLQCPGVANPNPVDHTCTMHPYRASFTSDGGIITSWENYSPQFGLYDRSFKLYNSGYEKVWDWQVVSDNLPFERAGFGRSLPPPVIVEITDGKYIYGDCDFDIRTLDRQTVQAIRKVNVATQKPGEVFQKRYLEVNAGISNMIIKNGKVFTFGFESGGSGYFAVLDILTKKEVIKWVETSGTYLMSVSKSGKWVGLYGSNNYIFNGLTGEKDFEIDRAHFLDFNPVDENELFVVYGNSFTIYRKE